jgi:hypothetical protein
MKKLPCLSRERENASQDVDITIVRGWREVGRSCQLSVVGCQFLPGSVKFLDRFAAIKCQARDDNGRGCAPLRTDNRELTTSSGMAVAFLRVDIAFDAGWVLFCAEIGQTVLGVSARLHFAHCRQLFR